MQRCSSKRIISLNCPQSSPSPRIPVTFQLPSMDPVQHVPGHALSIHLSVFVTSPLRSSEDIRQRNTNRWILVEISNVPLTTDPHQGPPRYLPPPRPPPYHHHPLIRRPQALPTNIQRGVRPINNPSLGYLLGHPSGFIQTVTPVPTDSLPTPRTSTPSVRGQETSPTRAAPPRRQSVGWKWAVVAVVDVGSRYIRGGKRGGGGVGDLGGGSLLLGGFSWGGGIPAYLCHNLDEQP